jgi:hypothetical protein
MVEVGAAVGEMIAGWVGFVLDVGFGTAFKLPEPARGKA